MKVEKEIIPNNLFNHNKNFIPKPRPFSKRENEMNLLLFNRPHRNNLIRISEKEQIEFINQKIQFNKNERPKSHKGELKEIKLPKIKSNHQKIKIKSQKKEINQTESNLLSEKKTEKNEKNEKNDKNEKYEKIEKKIEKKEKNEKNEKKKEKKEKKKRLKLKINSELENENLYKNNIRYNQYIKEYYKCENQNSNFRKEMEDITYTNINFIENKNHSISLFAIYDGHNGKFVSEYLNKNIPKILYSKIEKNDYQIEKSIIETFKEININLEKIPNAKETGSTATLIIIDNNIFYCANVGDSQCYYITKEKIIQMTNLHNCKNEKEIERVKKNKGLIFQNRVFGSLSLTRSIGDNDFKEFGVSGIPNIKKEILNDNYSQFIILGSDGVWDVINESFLWELQKKNLFLNSKDFCEKIVSCSIQFGSRDNVSCVVIKV